MNNPTRTPRMIFFAKLGFGGKNAITNPIKKRLSQKANKYQDAKGSDDLRVAPRMHTIPNTLPTIRPNVILFNNIIILL